MRLPHQKCGTHKKSTVAASTPPCADARPCQRISKSSQFIHAMPDSNLSAVFNACCASGLLSVRRLDCILFPQRTRHKRSLDPSSKFLGRLDQQILTSTPYRRGKRRQQFVITIQEMFIRFLNHNQIEIAMPRHIIPRSGPKHNRS